MSKIKLPEANYLASFVRSMKATGESPCGPYAPSTCLSSTVKTCYALAITGMKFDFYKGRRCPHGLPTTGGNLAYMLDNYAEPAIKAPCDPSWKSLLRGTVAILMFQGAEGDPNYNPVDLWAIDGCFDSRLLDQGAAKSLWVWPLGAIANPVIKAKHSHHHAKYKPVIF